MRSFVKKCLVTVSLRLSARELLDDPFLQIDGLEQDCRSLENGREVDYVGPLSRERFVHESGDGGYRNGYCNGFGYETPNNDWGYHPAEIELTGIDLFEPHEDEHPPDLDISIKGKRRDDGGIFLRIGIADKDGMSSDISVFLLITWVMLSHRQLKLCLPLDR